MERPGPSLVASIGVHGAIIGAIVLSMMFGVRGPAPRPMVTSVPVQVISEQLVLGAPADNPSEELVADDAATAPVETVAEPTPPVPTPPAPATPRPPEKATAPRPTPPRPTPPRPATPPPTPRPAAPQPRPGLNLDALAGEPRPGPRAPRAPTGGGSTGTASQTSGPVITAMFEQVYRNWNVFIICDMPGGNELRIQMDVTLSADGRITEGPTLVGARNSEVYRASAEEAMRALRATAPFDVPRSFTGGRYRATFMTERACRNR